MRSCCEFSMRPYCPQYFFVSQNFLLCFYELNFYRMNKIKIMQHQNNMFSKTNYQTSLNSDNNLFYSFDKTPNKEYNPNYVEKKYSYVCQPQIQNNYLPIPMKHNIQKSRSSLQKSKIRVSAMMEEQSDSSNLLDLNLMTKAINNSYMKRLSGDQNELRSNQIIKMIADFGFKSILKTKIKLDSKQKIGKKWENYDFTPYFIVQIDQNSLISVNQSNFSLSVCGSCNSTANKNMGETPFDEIKGQLKLYSLVFQMGANQLHFQCLQQQKSIYLNIDTIALQVLQSPIPKKEHEQLKYPIVLKSLSSNPIQIAIYLTPRTIPFPMCNKNINSNMPYLAETYKRLSNLLENCLFKSRGRNLNLKVIQDIILKNQYKFFQKRFATEEQFERYSQTGDILLFRGKHFFGKLQRVFTNSYYDHVGIVYRSQQFGICLFESNSGMGVAMAIWKQLLRYKWYEGLQKISWRKLRNNDLSKDLQKKVGEFIKLNLNKQFKLNLAKLLKFRSTIGQLNGSQKKNYFCSELVATLYKYLGFLEANKSSTQYWPKDFSDGEGLEMINSALDPQRHLIFQDQIIHERYPYIQ